jgi:HAMP domain-containing protein
MKGISIGTRMLILVAIIVLALAVIYMVAFEGMREIRATYDRASTDRAPVTRVINDFRSSVPDIKLQVFSMLIPEFDKVFLNQQLTDMVALEKDNKDFIADWEKNAAKGASPAENARFLKVAAADKAMWAAINDYNTHIRNWMKTGSPAERKAAFDSNDSGPVDATTNTLEESLNNLITINTRENSKVRAEARREMQAATTQLQLAVGITLVLTVAIALAIASSITRPMNAAVRFADAVAGGDLTAKMEQHAGGEVGELTRAIEAMKESLVERMDQMNEVAAMVSIAAGRVTSTAGEVIEEAGKSGNSALVAAGEKLSREAGNLNSALSSFGPGQAGATGEDPAAV